MARNLAHNADDEEGETSGGKVSQTSEKAILNRRQYVLLGAATVGAALTPDTSLASSSSDSDEMETTFRTDFSEYST